MFSGNLLPGTDAWQARLRLTAFFRLTDPAAVESFFLGSTVTLRRALPQAEAEALRDRLIAGGLDCRLIARFEPGIGEASAPPPNLFQIRRDPHAPEQLDADTLQLRFLATAVGTGLAGLALAAALLARLIWWSPSSPVSGPTGISAAEDGTLYLLAGNRLLVHNRAGSSTAEFSAADLGLQAIDQLLQVREGRPILSATAEDDPSALRPWLCSLTAAEAADSAACEALTSAPLALDSLTTSALTDTLFAITEDRALVRIEAGEAADRVPLPAINPSLRLINHRGLLLLNNSEGPGLAVHRPDATTFGQQLDEILLLHPQALAREQNRISDFAVTAGARWALLSSDSTTGLYRFEDSWAPAEAVALPGSPVPQRLATWRDRLLVYSPNSLRIDRINGQGRIEAPLLSDSLDALAASSRARSARDRALFTLGLTGLGVATAIGAFFTWIALHGRSRQPRRGLAPAFMLEHRLRQLHWLSPDPGRAAARRGWALAATAAALLTAVALVTGQANLAAVSLPMLFLALGALHCLSLPVVQVGCSPTDLALVDHRGIYQTGPRDSFQVLGPFILRGGVIGCLGLPGLPGLHCADAADGQRAGAGPPLPGTCPTAHPASVVDLLLRSRHPLLLPALAIPAGLLVFSIWRALH